jgi:hypothetical protein
MLIARRWPPLRSALTKAAIAISDGVAACGCHVNIPLIRAALYLLVRDTD